MEYYYEAIGNYEEHKTYYDVMNEYAESETLKEILLFMDEAFPEWKTNAGIGYWSAELVSDMLSFYADSERGQREVMEDLYTDLSTSYISRKGSFDIIYQMQLINDFEREYEYELEENEHLAEKEYSAFYDLLFEEYKEEQLKEEVCNFKDTLVVA